MEQEGTLSSGLGRAAPETRLAAEPPQSLAEPGCNGAPDAVSGHTASLLAVEGDRMWGEDAGEGAVRGLKCQGRRCCLFLSGGQGDHCCWPGASVLVEELGEEQVAIRAAGGL